MRDAAEIAPSRLAWRYSRLLVQHPRMMALIPVFLCVLMLPLALTATQHTVPDGWLPERAEAVQVQQLAADEFGRSNTTYYLLFSDPTGTLSADDPEFIEHVQFAVRPFRAMPEVAEVFTWGTTRSDLLNSILISEDRSSSLAVITLAQEPRGDFGTPAWLRDNLNNHSLSMQLTGLPVIGEDFRIAGHNDLVRAELISLPITLVLLIIIFRGVVPALLPVALAAGSMVFTLAAMNTLGRLTPVNVFTVNTVTMLGLAVGIDYALIMVSRYREELQHNAPEVALAATFATAGRTVIVAGTTVAIGLSGLFFFRVPAATSTAVLGATVVLITVALALTALPAAMVLGARHIERAHQRRAGAKLLPRIERWREQHPVLTTVLCIALLAVLTAPVMGMRGVSPGINNLPPQAESRVAADRILEGFPAASTSPIEIVLQAPDATMLEGPQLSNYQQIAVSLEQIEGVQRIESLWDFVPTGFSPGTLATSFVLEPDLIDASRPFITPNAALITVIAEPGLSHDEQRTLVEDIRAHLAAQPSGGLHAMVGGSIGLDIDLLTYITDRIPIVLAWIIGLTALALFAQVRSIALPIKAIALNLASIGASFGALVWIFQEGHLSSVLRFEPQGTTVLLVPVLMFCFLFGLSMDFEIIMLSRIRESWLEHGDTNRAINVGLDRAAGIVTASAVLMLTVFLAFGFSQLDVVKALGIGLAIAVALDATIVRMLLLPATMQLMGRGNWWPTRRTSASSATRPSKNATEP